MIYLILNEYWAKISNVPQYIAYSSCLMGKIPRELIASSDFVFMFREDGSTYFFKNRYFERDDFTSEERLVIKLKSVLM